MFDTDGLAKRMDVSNHFKHISYSEKIERGLIEHQNTDPKKIVKRGWEDWDRLLGGIFGGKIYVVGAETGTGKTTFVNQVVESVSKQGWRVVRYSLEDRLEDSAKEQLFYTVNRIRGKEGKKPYNRVDFICNDVKDKDFQLYLAKAVDLLGKNKNVVELDKEKEVSIDDLVVLMEEEALKGARVFAIDHLHYFDFGEGDRLDIQIKNVMHKINEIARKYNVAVFLVAHYKGNTGEKYLDYPSPSYFRDGSAIKQVANVIIQIQRDVEDDKSPSLFYFTKIRGPNKRIVLKTNFNLSTYEYDFKKTGREQRPFGISI